MHKKKTTPWARRRRRVYIIVALVAAFVTPAVIWRLGLKTDVREEIAALRAEGVPTTAEEIAAWVAKFPPLGDVEEYRKLAHLPQLATALSIFTWESGDPSEKSGLHFRSV